MAILVDNLTRVTVSSRSIESFKKFMEEMKVHPAIVIRDDDRYSALFTEDDGNKIRLHFHDKAA